MEKFPRTATSASAGAAAVIVPLLQAAVPTATRQVRRVPTLSTRSESVRGSPDVGGRSVLTRRSWARQAVGITDCWFGRLFEPPPPVTHPNSVEEEMATSGPPAKRWAIPPTK